MEKSGNNFCSCMYKRSAKWYTVVGYFIILMIFAVIFIEGMIFFIEGMILFGEFIKNLHSLFLIGGLYFLLCGLIIGLNCYSIKQFFRKILFEFHISLILLMLWVVALFCCTVGVAIALAIALSYIFFTGISWLVGCVMFSMLFIPINISLYECLHLHEWFDTAINYIGGWYSCKSE